jgi:hypothetical protein
MMILFLWTSNNLFMFVILLLVLMLTVKNKKLGGFKKLMKMF